MKKSSLHAALASLAVLFVPHANALVLDFEGLGNGFFSADYMGFRFGDNGGSLTNDWFSDPGPSPLYIRSSPTTAVGFSPVGPLPPAPALDALESKPVTMADGGDFTLDGAYFSGYDYNSTGTPNSAQVFFRLYNNGVLVGTSGILTPNNTSAQFLSTGLLSTVVIDAFTVVGPAPFFLMDDLSVNPVTAVPEPATYGMMFLGLAAVGAVVRKRQLKA